jgi:phage-related protein
MYDILFYKDKNGNESIRDYLQLLAEKATTSKNHRVKQKKILEYINILRMVGTTAGLPAIKHIEDDIWELRPLDNRIFYAYYKDNTYILLHHYLKKTQKSPRRQIDQAKRNLEDFLKRSGE